MLNIIRNRIYFDIISRLRTPVMSDTFASDDYDNGTFRLVCRFVYKGSGRRTISETEYSGRAGVKVDRLSREQPSSEIHAARNLSNHRLIFNRQSIT